MGRGNPDDTGPDGTGRHGPSPPNRIRDACIPRECIPRECIQCDRIPDDRIQRDLIPGLPAMIGKIAGRLDHRGGDHVLIDVRGIGYIVHVSDRTLASMPRVGEAVALFTELLVREDLLQLFGFPTMLEKEWHRLLVTVQGVGAKAAMAILGTLGPDGVARAIALGDAKAVQAAPGIGPKIAQRVILELKSKAPSLMAMGADPGVTADAGFDDVVETSAPRTAVATAPPRAAHSAEALSALINLGYAHGDAAQAVAQAAGANPEADTSTLIRAALRMLAPRG